MIQVTAYECMGALQLQVTRSDASETGYQWTHLINEMVEIPSWLEGDTWDAVWLIAEHMHQAAMRRAEGNRPKQ